MPKLAWLLYALARFIGITTKIRAVGWEQYAHSDRALIFAGWHGTTLLCANFFRNRGIYTIVSNSRDGEMQNKIMHLFGYKTIRGSTGRGGIKAAIESIKVLKEGHCMAFTPDGPRGPSGVVQEGVVMMAGKSGALMIPVGTSARRRMLAKSWDKYMIPAPFNKAVLVFGDPIIVADGATKEQMEEARLKLEGAIHRVQAEADHLMGHA